MKNKNNKISDLVDKLFVETEKGLEKYGSPEAYLKALSEYLDSWFLENKKVSNGNRTDLS